MLSQLHITYGSRIEARRGYLKTQITSASASKASLLTAQAVPQSSGLPGEARERLQMGFTHLDEARPPVFLGSFQIRDGRKLGLLSAFLPAFHTVCYSRCVREAFLRYHLVPLSQSIPALDSPFPLSFAHISFVLLEDSTGQVLTPFPHPS